MNAEVDQHISRAVITFNTDHDNGSGSLSFSVDICGINEADAITQATVSNFFTTRIENSIEAFSESPVARNRDGVFIDDRLSFQLFDQGSTERNQAIVEHLKSDLKMQVFHESNTPNVCNMLMSGTLNPSTLGAKLLSRS